MGVLEWIGDSHDARVVAGPTEVATEVALKGGPKSPATNLMRDRGDKTRVTPCRVEDLTRRGFVVLGVPDVALQKQPAACKALRNLDRATGLGNAGAEESGKRTLQRAARLGSPRLHRDHSSAGIRPVSHRGGTARDLDASHHRRVEKGRARADASFRRHAPGHRGGARSGHEPDPSSPAPMGEGPRQAPSSPHRPGDAPR